MPENPNKAPTIDPKAWQRNKTTAWLEFIDHLSSWLWQDNEDAARWTLVLDDAERHSSTTHPPRTAPGLKAQVLPSASCTRCVHRHAARRDERDEHSAREHARPARHGKQPLIYLCICERAFGVLFRVLTSAAVTAYRSSHRRRVLACVAVGADFISGLVLVLPRYTGRARTVV
jgi:hypothetical protein